MQRAAAAQVQPAALPAAISLQLNVPVCAKGKWREAVTAAKAVAEWKRRSWRKPAVAAP